MKAGTPVYLRRSVQEPITNYHGSFDQRWHGPDRGLIVSWECGRLMAREEPDRGARAKAGELVMLPWKGGTERIKDAPTRKTKRKLCGCLRYLAMWQGLRGEDLHIVLDRPQTICCSTTGETVTFAAQGPEKQAAKAWLLHLNRHAGVREHLLFDVPEEV